MVFRDAGTRIEFEFDWMSAHGVEGPELAATWASLRIHVGESTITRVLDERSRTIRDMVFVSLYPLAEWLVSNWWFLLYEFENPDKENDREFDRRHSLRFGREGYGYPDLQIVSSGHLVRLVWKRDDPNWFRHASLEQGWTWIDRASWHKSCANLIDSVIARLHEFHIHNTLLEQDWSAIQSADKEETEFCKTAGGLGWDPYALNDDALASVARLGEVLTGDALEEAAAVFSAKNLIADIADFRKAVGRARRNSLGLKRIVTEVLHNGFVSETRSDPDAELTWYADAGIQVPPNPWKEGYALARSLRQSLELGNDPLPTWDTLARALGEPPEQVEKATRPTSLGNLHMLEGVISRVDDGKFTFAFSAKRASSRRFLFCRALADVRVASEPSSVLTRARSWRQQRGRAFAAEFLVPAHAIRNRISSHVILADDIDLLAREFGVSWLVIRHQVDNHDIARIWSEARSHW
ncbi:MAG: hypothetical protein OXE86_21835 [Alphaproteobacteria bacterium]|nr:hypothetical protein [Alphaproteobacteria bacterium]